MATDPMLQWQSHVTDSTDRETILGNIDFLENFAGAITGDDSLQGNFAAIRKEINNGTLKPTDWKTSQDFTDIITKLKEASSGKIKTLDDGLGNKLDSKDFSDFKTGDFKTGDFKTVSDSVTDHGTRLDTAEGTLTSHTTALGEKLDSSTFENFKTGDSSWKSKMDKKVKSFALSTELENVKTLLNNEVSHWTAESAPAPAKDYLPAAQIKASTQPWGKNEDPARHVNDLCTVIGEGQKDKGVSYRFVKDPNVNSYSYKWVKVIDNDGALALSKLSTFEQKYNQDSGEKKSIDETAKKVAEQGKQIEDQRKKLSSSYKVTVTTKGYIRNGEIIDGTTSGGVPVIRHTAHVYDIAGNKVTDTAITSKLTWIINKGRTTEPKQHSVTGDICDVTAKYFVQDGTNPHYYDIELSSLF